MPKQNRGLFCSSPTLSLAKPVYTNGSRRDCVFSRIALSFLDSLMPPRRNNPPGRRRSLTKYIISLFLQVAHCMLETQKVSKGLSDRSATSIVAAFCRSFRLRKAVIPQPRGWLPAHCAVNQSAVGGLPACQKSGDATFLRKQLRPTRGRPKL